MCAVARMCAWFNVCLGVLASMHADVNSILASLFVYSLLYVCSFLGLCLRLCTKLARIILGLCSKGYVQGLGLSENQARAERSRRF